MRRWRLLDGRTLAEAPSFGKVQYYQLDREGKVERTYGESTTSVQEELHRMSFVVLGRQLMRRHTVERGSSTPEDVSGVELDGLTQLTAMEAPDEARTRASIAAHEAGERALEAERQARIERVSDAAGASARDVARGLAERVVRYDDGLARAMLANLRSLAEVKRARRGADAEPLRGAAEAMALAARLISFEGAVPEPSRSAPPVDDAAAALIDKLDALRDQLRAAAEGQDAVSDSVTGSENGRIYRRAAELLRLAIHHLLVAGKGAGGGEA
jgi:hypothetical protein